MRLLSNNADLGCEKRQEGAIIVLTQPRERGAEPLP